jgi:hypothetical protein
METVIFVLSAIILAGAIEWGHQWKDHKALRETWLSTIDHLTQALKESTDERRKLLAEQERVDTELKRLANPKETVFDKDEPLNKMLGRMAYIPVARRRAQAERLSLGPKNHDEKVRENNTRAIESAG